MEPTPQPKERQFRVCDACGRLTPSNLPRCVECGEASAQAVAEAAERASEERFARSFFTRGAPATWALIGANVAIFVLLASIARTINPSAPSYQSALIELGAKVNALIDAGQTWRFVTPMFLHVGAFHLLVNMYSLYAIGPQVERLYGTARFLLIYLVSGVVGVAASYAYPMNKAVVSAGASGALFGLLGVLLVFGLRYRSELPGMFRQAFSPRGLIPVLLLNLFLTFSISAIDKGAHLGGLAAGAALGAAIPYFRPDERRASLVWRILACLAVVATLGCFAAAFKSFDPSRIKPVTTTEINRFIKDYNDTQGARAAALSAASDAADGKAVKPEAVTTALEAAQRASGCGLDDDSRALFGRETELLTLSARAIGGERGARPTADEIAKLKGDAKDLDDAWAAWLKANGDAYGIRQTEDSETPGGNDGH